MIEILFFAFVLLATLLAAGDWRKGVLLMLAVGLLQDPIRKMMPDAPGYMVLAFIPVWAAVVYSVLFSGNNAWSRFLVSQPRLEGAVQALGFSLALAFIVLLLNYGIGVTPVGVIGLIGYLFPLMAIAVGYYFIRDVSDLVYFVKVYAVLAAIALIGGLLEYWEIIPQWNALGTEALGTTWFRQYTGHIVYMISGFFRSPDLMGWHAALVVMFGMIMSLRSRDPLARAAWIILTVWGAVNLIISGRNKMIFMPAIFVCTIAILNLYKGISGRAVSAVLKGIAIVSILLAASSVLNLDEEFLLYTQKGSGDATERFTKGGLMSVWTTYKQSGFFGEGLGSASTGARYGGKSEIKTWQESGLSKIMVELGVIGFFSAIFLGLTIVNSVRYQLLAMPVQAKELQLYFGIIAIAVANLASFVISHQAFGDPFLVTLAGFILGIAMSAPRWATNS